MRTPVRFRAPGLVLLALSAACVAGCFTPLSVPVEPVARDRVAETCQQVIAEQTRERFGRRSVVSFDSPDTYYISSALEGVRGGGLVRAGHDRTRIQYDCTVNIRSSRVVQAQHRVIDAFRPAGWSVDACQDRIREKVVSDRRRRTDLKFGEVETSDLSLEREKVRGHAKLKSGGSWQRIHYSCTANLRRGRIEAASYGPEAEPPLSDREAVALCQGAVVEEARGDRGRGANVSFESGSAHSVSRHERAVQGRAQLRAGDGPERIAYECRVDDRARQVADARYQLLEKPEFSKEQIIDACQSVTREMAAADHGRRASVRFETAETYESAKREMGVQGRGRLRVGDDRDPIHYQCTVDLRRLKITEARYRPIESTRDQRQRTVALCHDAVRERVASDRDGRVSLGFDRSETYFLSNSKEGVRGEAGLRYGGRRHEAIRYECEVDIRRGRVTDVRYRYR